MGLSSSEDRMNVVVLTNDTGVWQTNRRTDGRNLS